MLYIFYAGLKSIIAATDKTVYLYDTELKMSTAEINIPGVKYAIWSSDMQSVALLSKHSNIYPKCPDF